MDLLQPTIKGRGANANPANPFAPLQFEPDGDELDRTGGDRPDDERPAPQTVYYKDTARTIIAHNDSPDVGFEYSINPYRGCSHGCIYCYARNTHSFFGLSAGLDFETKIFVKQDAPELLRKELSNPRYKPVTLSISGVTDCYQPAERQFKITRRCLEVLAECRNPVGVITKNHLVTRDIDLLAELAEHGAAVAILSITTLDNELSARMEPRASAPAKRLAAVEELTRAGVPAGVMVAPVIPGLTDHEVPAILSAAAAAGAVFAGFVPVRLPLDVAPLFEDWLARHYPDRRDKVLNRIRSLRGGKLNDSNFHTRMHGEGVWAQQLKTVFDVARRKAGLDRPFPELSTGHFRRPRGAQMALFE
jgi:DNA repair photolyase